MIDANAPAWPRRLGRWLAMLLVAVGAPMLIALPALAVQQDEGGDQAGSPEAPANEEEPTPQEIDEQEVIDDSIYVDPVATAAMRGSFDQLYTNVLVPPNSDRTILQMARGASRLDSGLVDRFIKYAARQLTDHDNLSAVSTPGASQARVRAIQDAGLYLMLPYVEIPPEQRDRRFLQEFNRGLLAVAPELLSNHLYARVQVMQALSRMASPQALDLLVSQLTDDNQPVIIKQLAADGIRRMALESGGDLSASDREKAAIALVTFLRNESETYWLAQVRALQALGSLRQISGIRNRDQASFADEALGALSSNAARPETRAWAAWALGMFVVPPSYPQLNYSLAAYQIGRLAVEIGERIADLSDPREQDSYNPERVKYLAALIVSPIFTALEGNSDLRGSGLRKSQALGPHQQYVLRVHQLIRQLATASVELTRARGNQRPPARDRLIASINELRTFLDQNEPEDNFFVPGGREFALQDAS